MARYGDLERLEQHFYNCADECRNTCDEWGAKCFETAMKATKNQPTADVVPRAEVEDLIRENESLAKTVIKSSELIRKLRSKLEKYRSVVERNIVIVGRRQGKEAESREIIRHHADLIREAAVREFAESLLEGRVGNDPVSVAVRVGLKSYLEDKI